MAEPRYPGISEVISNFSDLKEKDGRKVKETRKYSRRGATGADRRTYLEKKKKELIASCTACGKCLKECRIFKSGKYRKEKPRAVMLSVIDLLKEEKFSDVAEYVALTCTNCGDCTSRCPEKLIPLLIFRAAVDKLADIGRAHKPVQDFAYLLGNLQLEKSDVLWVEEVGEKERQAETVLFPGCDSIRAPCEILTDVDILERLGLNFVTIWNEDLCCGFKGYSVNDFEEGDRLAKKLISTIESFGARRLLLPCGQCYYQFKRNVSKLFSYSFEVSYFPQFLKQTIDRFGFNKEINRKVTVHDSCKIARSVRDFESVRTLLSRIPGVELLEMERTRERSLCCGGIKNFSYPELTASLVKERLQQAEEIKADILATDCTLCCSIFTTVERCYPIETRHYISLVAEAMGLEARKDSYKEILSLEKNEILEKVTTEVRLGGMTNDDIQKHLDTYMGVVAALRAGCKQISKGSGKQ
jgi:Fe-S oxidoreductase